MTNCGAMTAPAARTRCRSSSLLRQNGWLRELAKAYRWYGKFLRRTGRPEAAMDALEQASDLSLRVKQAVGDA